MSLVKAAIILVCGLVFAGALVTMASIAVHDKPMDPYYNNSDNSINGTQEMTEKITGTGAGMMPAVVLVGGILFLLAALVFLRRSAGR